MANSDGRYRAPMNDDTYRTIWTRLLTGDLGQDIAADLSTQPLLPSQEKIRRAQRKFNQLKSIINGYVASQPYAVRLDSDGNTRRLVARRDKEPPEDIAFEVVEIVGHLRSSLDKLIVATVAFNGRGVSGVGFPFGALDNGKPEPFPSARMKLGVKKKLTAQQWALIEAHRPYPGGNDTLWAINQIANADKHGADLVSVIPVNTGGLGIGTPGTNWKGGVMSIWPPQDDALPYDYEREKVLLTVTGGSGQLGVDHQPTPEIVFGEIVPVAGQNVLVTLNAQIRLTERIVKRFRDAFF